MSGLSDAVDIRPGQHVTLMHQLKQDWPSSPYSFVVPTDERVLLQVNLPPALIFLPQHK